MKTCFFFWIVRAPAYQVTVEIYSRLGGGSVAMQNDLDQSHPVPYER